MPTTDVREAAANDEAQIRRMIERWAESIRGKDVDSIEAAYAPGLVAFEPIPLVRYTGTERHRKDWSAWLGSFEGPADCELRDVSISVDGDVAFAHGLVRLGRPSRGGAEGMHVWNRWTAGFRKQRGAWQIVHEHVSVPVDMATGTIAKGAEP